MDELRRQVRRAQRRLAAGRFLRAFGLATSLTLLLAVALIGLGKVRALPVPDWAWAAAALVLGILAAVVWTWTTGRGALSAAIEIDRRFGLKERVSTALAMPGEERDSPVGRTVIEDATQRVRRIDVASQFPVAPGRLALVLPVLPGLAALVLALFVPPPAPRTAAATSGAAASTVEQVKKSTEALERRLAERRRMAEREGLEDAKELLKNLENKSKEFQSLHADRKEALVKLKDLTRQLQERRDQLHGAERVAEQLRQFKSLSQGPADKLAQAVARGDFKKALAELKDLKDQLSGDKLDPQQREQLAKQMEEVAKKLREMADAHDQAVSDLRKQISQLHKSGQHGEADKLQQSLDKLLQQLPRIQQASDLARQLGQCSKCLREGKTGAACAALDSLRKQLAGLEKESRELQLLDDAMEQLGQAKEQMNCQHCGGAGCPFCQGEPRETDGGGLGRAWGTRPERRGYTSLYDSQVRQKLGPGSSTFSGWVEGPNVKGNVQQRIQQQIEAARQGAAEPITEEQMPREHRQHTQEYFDRLRTGK
jgi:tetratricopeptide (TPR) repeat protein